MTAATSDGLRKSSGITTETKSPSPCGKAQMYSKTASSGSSSGSRISRCGLPSASSKKRGRMPGSLSGKGTWIARTSPLPIPRAYQSASRVASSSRST